MRRRVLGKSMMLKTGLFEYVKTEEFSNIYSKVEVKLEVEDRAAYCIIGEEGASGKIAFINVKDGKFGIAYVTEDTSAGINTSNNYTVKDGIAVFNLNGFGIENYANGKAVLDIYKYKYD